MSLRQSRLSFGPKSTLVASASKEGSKTDKAAGEQKEISKAMETSSTAVTTTADVTMEEDEESSFKIKKRSRRVIDTDDEDEPIALAVEADVSLTQEHREEELNATTKKLKLDPNSPKKPKGAPAVAKEKTKETAQETPKENVKEVKEVKEIKEAKEKAKAVVAEDIVETPSASEDKEIEEAEKEDEEQEKEAVEIKQAAANWADMFSKSGGVESASWKKGEPVPYAALCQTFELIEDTTKRLQILDYLVKFLIQVIKLSPESLLTVIYLSINKLCPEYEGLELGIGESLLMKAIAESTGREMKKIKESYAEIGDLGVVAMSQKQKVDKIKVLLVSCRNKEAKYLMRSLEGKLRIGLAERTVVVALAQAIVLSRPDIKKLSKEKLQNELEEAASVVKSVYSELPCYDMIVPALLSGDIEGLKKACKLTPGIPLKPMLAHPTKALTDILDRFENIAFTCEYKYDGERAQIHKLEEGSTMIYSRNSENMSAKYPDVMERLYKFAKPDTKSFVLDCEAVAWDREQKCILPFQVLSTRKRKDVKEEDIKVQVCIFAFDLLYLNGESLLREPLAKRRQLLLEHFLEVDGEFSFAKSMNSTQIEDIQTFLDHSVADNCEGLMVKTMDGTEASYEPSKRSRNWLKVKKDYLAGVGDSIDLVVIGAYIGRGKRTGVYGGYLLACYDPEREEYQSICKIGTGFSEQDLEDHHKELKEHTIAEPKSYYVLGEGNRPDVWFAPVKVWEIKCADLSVSPVYKAAVGIVDSTKGISLRFPRFIRIRDDKAPENATSSEQIAEMYNDQKLNTVKNDTSMGVDMDFDY
ncbi:hypothetical protein BGZ82_003319 [Podila clonocystis]|nr:hypothetical protein BGZ82_003319 [Podila clonocystis]